jgi:FkbM family methyltransferase
MSLLSQIYHHIDDSRKDRMRLTRLKYDPQQRHSLISSLQASGHETDMLGYHVNYLDGEAFRWALREIFFDNDYAFESSTDSPTILDCGANIGLATLYFKHLYPKAHIACFEADPTTAAILRRNVDQNHLQDVSVNHLMLSSTDGEHSFYVDPAAPGNLKMSGVPGRVSNCREIVVKTGKLSDYIESRIDLVKLDVEGAEFDVMTDLNNSGKLALIQRMVIEYHHRIDGQPSKMGKFLSLLEAEGFEYQIAAKCYPITRQNYFQDVLIGAYRPVH